MIYITGDFGGVWYGANDMVHGKSTSPFYRTYNLLL